MPTLIAIDSIALVWSIVELVERPPGLHASLVATLLAGIALVFEEAMTRTSRFQLRFGRDLKRDMTSVWAVAGAVALPPSAAVLLLLVVITYAWFRHGRPSGEAPFRRAFNASNHVVSCLCAATASDALSAHSSSLPWGMADSLAAVGAILVFTLANRLITTWALTALGVRGKQLMGSRDDNLSELAALCLGGLVSLAAIHQPLLAILVIAPMVTLQRGAVMRELETAATTDAKTGLLNAVAWEEIASRELLRAAREGTDLTVLIIDIDHFKRVNDGHGHLVGDRVLRRLARVLLVEVREYDTVARFGGEEFVAVLPATSSADALMVAERLRMKVNELRISAIVDGIAPELDQRLAVSIGVATAPMDGVELPDLLHAADGALYRAKDNGRNRVELADFGTGESLQTLPFA